MASQSPSLAELMGVQCLGESISALAPLRLDSFDSLILDITVRADTKSWHQVTLPTLRLPALLLVARIVCHAAHLLSVTRICGLPLWPSSCRVLGGCGVSTRIQQSACFLQREQLDSS